MFVEAKKRLRTPQIIFWPLKLKNKLIFGSQKMEKIIFFKKPKFCDLTDYWGWFPQWVGSICSIPRSPVNSFYIDFSFGKCV